MFFPVQNTFLEFRSQNSGLSLEYAKRGSLPASFAPAAFPPPTPFTYRPSFVATSSLTLAPVPEKPRSPPAKAVQPVQNVSTSKLAFGPAPTAAVAPVARSSVSEATSSPRRRKSLADRGWQAVLVHSEAFKDSTSEARAKLALPPFGLPARCYKSADAFLRAFEKKREPQKAVIFVEASEAVDVLTWISARRFSHILHVVVIGAPRAGGAHAAEAAAYVRSLDAGLVEAELLAEEND